MPGRLDANREWYRNYYEVPDGKPQNRFSLNEQFMGKCYAATIIEEALDVLNGLLIRFPNGFLKLPSPR